MRPAVFLDRDDTLIVNRAITAHTPYPGSLFDPNLVKLCPGAAQACRSLRHAGFALVVVTNQGCVARGECTVEQVEATNARVRAAVFAEAGVDLDGVYYCPYHPKGTVPPFHVEHPWRKPNPGMILWAADDLRLDLARSWMIGDAERDIVAALRAGIGRARTIIVGDAPAAEVGHRVATIAQAAEIVLQSAKDGPR